MCPHTPGNPEKDQPGGVPRCTRPAVRAGVTVERIESEPMTSDEYRLAVVTLAALINQWQHDHEKTSCDGKSSA